MTDLEIIKGYKDGSITGITISEHCLFMPVRISGLGKTIRLDEDSTKQSLADYFNKADASLEELVSICKESNIPVEQFVKYMTYDRKDEDFANDDILVVYQGLPILKNHPHNDNGDPCLLDFNNFNSNDIIGCIIEAYRLNGAIWGLARIYDIALLELLESEYSSTSPAVYSINIEEKSGIITEKPYMFNHLAFVEKGHWDSVDKKPYDAEKLNIIIDGNLLEKGEAMEDSIKDETKVDESTEELSEEIEEIKKAEKEEAEHFEEMSEEHSNIDQQQGDSPMNEEVKVDNEVSENSISENSEETKTDEVIEEVSLTDQEEDLVDEDEVIDEMENIEDEERDALVDNFRQAIDSAHPSLNLKMPYIGQKRMKPSVIISKILKANKSFVDSKYKGLLLETSDRSDLTYNLKVDAYNSMLDNIKNKTDAARQKSATGRGYWEKTDKPNIVIDRNF
ncbi:hypothetical protein JF110_001659 [Campylobacter jejuni]|nr:hypothetical protein [Campylobacter jejuni]